MPPQKRRKKKTRKYQRQFVFSKRYSDLPKMPTKDVVFEAGRLGMGVKLQSGKLLCCVLEKDGQADKGGVKLGQVLTGVGGKTLTDLKITDDRLMAGHLQKAARPITLNFEMTADEANLAVCTAALAAWGANDVPKMKALWTDDVCFDSSANMSNTDGYKVYKGKDQAMKWIDFLATMDLQNFAITSMTPGPNNSVYVMNSYTPKVKTTGKECSVVINDTMIFTIKNGLLAHLRFHSGDQLAVDEMFKAPAAKPPAAPPAKDKGKGKKDKGKKDKGKKK
jgi:hypothetical protein